MNVPPDHSLPEIFHRQKLCRRAKVLGLKVDDESLVGRQRKRTLVEARHCCSWAHSRRSLHLHIENTELQPLASAFFKLPNLVCGRSESPLTALSVDRHERPRPDLRGRRSEGRLRSQNAKILQRSECRL
jgi:hypothetical protein